MNRKEKWVIALVCLFLSGAITCGLWDQRNRCHALLAEQWTHTDSLIASVSKVCR